MKWLVTGRAVWLSLGLFLSASSFCFSQSFEDGKTYQVTGLQLNRLERDLTTAKEESGILRTRNEQLEKDSENKVKALTDLTVQLQTASQSLKKSEEQTLVNEILIGGGCLLVGFGTGIIVWEVIR